MTAIEAALDGKPLSEFEESFPIVLQVLDMIHERDQLRAALNPDSGAAGVLSAGDDTPYDKCLC